jgi:hypothetical protein
MCKPWKISGFNLFDQLKPSEQRLIQPEEGRPAKRHKASRKRWCRGKEGVEHQPVCMTYEQAKGPSRYPSQAAERFRVCKVCGKELAHFWGLALQKGHEPDWVTC